MKEVFEPQREEEEEEESTREKIQKLHLRRRYRKSFQKAYRGETVFSSEPGGSLFQRMPEEKGRRRVLPKKKVSLGKVLAVGLLLLVITVISFFIGMVGITVGSLFLSTTYPSKDKDILDTEEAYHKLEEALNTQVNQIQSKHPGYDEYRFQVDEISHNPYELISYFTVKYGDFTYAEIKAELQTLFGRQYSLTLTESVETRTRTVTKTGYREVIDPKTKKKKLEAYTYEEEEKYEVTILNVVLKNKGLQSIAYEDFSEEKYNLFSLYNTLHGNRDGIFDESLIPITSVEAYEIPPEALSDAAFANMIAEANKYLGYPYVWGGEDPTTSFDCSGFVSYVINNCGNGWNVGRQTADGLCNLCATVSPSDAKPGDLIFFQGTYATSGASHVGIYVGNGMMIHCGNPIQYASINTPYWKAHFYKFGRLY